MTDYECRDCGDRATRFLSDGKAFCRGCLAEYLEFLVIVTGRKQSCERNDGPARGDPDLTDERT